MEKKNDAEGIVRLCDYMLILHFEDKCAAELITAEPISDRGESGVAFYGTVNTV